MHDAKKVSIPGKTGFMQQNFLATKFISKYFVDFGCSNFHIGKIFSWILEVQIS